jgi:hypothetical protein
MALIQTTVRNYKGSDFLSYPGAPCLACVSAKEKLGIVALALATDLGLTVDEMVKASSCLKCMSEGQMLTGLGIVMANAFMPESGPVTAETVLKCVRCRSDKELLAAILYGVANELGFVPD